MRALPAVICALCLGCASSHRQLAGPAFAHVEKPALDYDSHQTAGAESAALRAKFEGALAPEVKAQLRHDPRLDLVAAADVDHFAANSDGLKSSLAQWVLWRAGVPGRFVHARVWNAGRKRNMANLDGDLTLEARAIEIPMKKRKGPFSYGIARLDNYRGTLGQAVVLATRRVELKATPKQVAPGSTFVIAGQAQQPHEKIRIDYETVEGQDVQVEAPVSPDGSFSVELTAPAVAGRYFFEIIGMSCRTTLATIPIHVGVAEPLEPDPPLDAIAQKQVLRTKLAALRSEKGKGSAEDAALDALAETLAQSVCKDGTPTRDHAPIVKALMDAGYANHKVKTVTRAIGDLYRLKKDFTGDDPATKAAITTCELENAEMGAQYVLMVSATK